MARPQIPASVLADRGVPLALMGHNVTLCYTFKSLMLLEERYGSLQKALEIVGFAQGDDENPENPDEGAAPRNAMDAKMFTGLAGIIACGLTHEVTPADDDGRPLSDPDVLADYLDGTKIAEYGDALGEAFAKSFPKAQEAAPVDPPEASPTASPGESGTTSPSSISDSPLVSSGL